MLCPVCSGTGKKWGYLLELCLLCNGSGRLPDERTSLPTCPSCDGTGRKGGHLYRLCPVCQGWGRLPPEQEAVREPEGPLVVFLEEGKLRSANLEPAAIFRPLKGRIRICDPYFGIGTLLRLDLLTHCDEIMFLTQKCDEKEEAIVSRAIAEFTKDCPGAKFRRYGGKDLHDRFLLVDDELILFGQGLKDIANRESFIIRLQRTCAGDIIDTVRKTFDERWKEADPSQ